jgi:hypothetical protein
LSGLSTAKIRAGWLPDFRLGEFVQEHPSIFAQLPYVLLSSVDSDLNVSAMPWAKALFEKQPGWAASSDPLVTSGDWLVRLLLNGELSLNGFDELWICSKLPVPRRPEEAYIVAPRQLNEEIPTATIRWMESSGCVLGLGDGYGLNFITTDMDLARRLELPVE